jgi:hypothetical protein
VNQSTQNGQVERTGRLGDDVGAQGHLDAANLLAIGGDVEEAHRVLGVRHFPAKQQTNDSI